LKDPCVLLVHKGDLSSNPSVVGIPHSSIFHKEINAPMPGFSRVHSANSPTTKPGIVYDIIALKKITKFLYGCIHAE
jgi:hypothetical protein